ncbi:hypothetical protein FRC05_003784 [Tulasnella sp. 425]|nr:hypothetical protein FRC05_003784 [Tulasnella sp. 425]
MPSQVSYAVGYAFGRPKPCITEIRGFDDLTPGDKSRVNEVFGWAEKVSTQSPEGGDAWGEDIENRYESSSERPPSSADLIQTVDSNQAEHETVESQFEEVLDAEKRREDDYEDEEGCHVVFEEPPKRTDSRNVPIRNSNPKPKPRLPTESTAPRLALLELEEKEARVRLAEAELRVAEACAKVEAARYSVIEHKLKMAKAGIKP